MQPAGRPGRLKIFLGAAAGVGKTYAMLEEATRRMAEGTDVVVGYVETYRRRGAETLLHGLPGLPRRKMPYSGVLLEEMDQDAILRRRPELVLVDELAHANAPGSRHAKRFHDVEELLRNGIDVYATLNIQNLKSLQDVVEQITGARVQETVPDYIFEQAHDVELIDAPPGDLLQRIKREDMDHPNREFLHPGNLMALRELALRHTAQRVDRELRAYMTGHGIAGPWPATERVLVCVGPDPLSQRLVRTARRLAASLDAEWTALHVVTPDQTRPVAGDSGPVASLLRLAEELGGRVETVTGLDVAETIAAYAKAQHITKIVIGRPLRFRALELWQGSVVDRLLRACAGIDVHVISEMQAEGTARRRRPSLRVTSPWWGYLAAVAMVTAVTVGAATIRHIMAPTNLAMMFLLVVVLAGLRWGRGPASLASVLGVLAFDFFFIPPIFSFTVADAQYVITFGAFLAVALVVSTLTGRLRDQVALSRRREEETAALYAFTRSMVAERNVHELLHTVVEHVAANFRHHVGVYLPGEEGLALQAESPDAAHVDEPEALDWAFAQGRPSGAGEHTLPWAKGWYLPLVTARGPVGVLALWPSGGGGGLGREQRRMLETMAAQAAVALERAELTEAARKAELLAEADRLHKALLNSISHDLRTPLASIMGSLSTLTAQRQQMRAEMREELVETAYTEAERLNRLVGNLLDMSRLESGILRPAADWHDLVDIIGTALEQMSSQLADRPVTVDVPVDTPLVYVDYVLVVQVLSNLLDNANKYAPAHEPIAVQVVPGAADVAVRVQDRGTWIPEEHRQRIFDKFYRVQRPEGPPGTGLGLAICKGFIEAHHGQIWVEPGAEGGTVVTFTLPTQPWEGVDDHVQ